MTLEPQPSHETSNPLPGGEDIDWLAGTDPEAETKRTADRRSLIQKRVLSAGGQLVVGLLILLFSIGLVLLAITNPRLPYLITAGVCAPPGLWFGIFRWKRWLGQAPYIYRLLMALGEGDDAEQYLVEYKNKKFKKARDKIHRQSR